MLILHIVKKEIPLTELSDLFAGYCSATVKGWHVLVHITYRDAINVPISLVFRETSVVVSDLHNAWRQRTHRRHRSDKVLEFVGLTKSTDDEKLTLSCPLRDDLLVKLSKGQRMALSLPLEGSDVHVDEARPLLAAYLASPNAEIQLFDRILYQPRKPITFELSPHTAKTLGTTCYWKFPLPVSRPLQESLNLISRLD
eukprot:Protomagalhaensia_sp_Gyna_25__2127@NODE_214_length_4362_cov_74_083738_g166_i0_p3_GENE_NODE_214_length_4362_cov_74_083738_g166_i0NODE_214_length_4362_cov_74_083738_g166_i0_p3_ORF_typecomplete_len198_score32_46_NODE_214_length_4362_cov_74_083738_g166_i010371630